MIVSVALCTYNGANFVEKQIWSILNQTMSVNEIVVCDDGSDDNTMQILEELLKETTIAFRVFRNERRLGPSRNFKRALELCQGDIVFLSDQDDIWKENKVQVVVDWFKENPTKTVVFSDADLIDEKGSLITKQSLWDCIGFSSEAQESFNAGFGVELFCCENRATGAAMAVRRDYAVNSRFVDVCNEIILHDGALAMLTLGDDSLGFIPERLTQYRCHGNQTVGLGATVEHHLSDDPRETTSLCDIWAGCGLPKDLKQRVEYVALRHRMIAQRKGLFGILRNRSSYKLYYHSRWKSFLHYDVAQWKRHLFSK